MAFITRDDLVLASKSLDEMRDDIARTLGLLTSSLTYGDLAWQIKHHAGKWMNQVKAGSTEWGPWEVRVVEANRMAQISIRFVNEGDGAHLLEYNDGKVSFPYRSEVAMVYDKLQELIDQMVDCFPILCDRLAWAKDLAESRRKDLVRGR